MKEIKRYDEIDILKSTGIILMIMGHIGFGWRFNYWIHSFHMPMFYFISGFLYRKSDLSFNKFLTKKGKSLIIPYFVFSTFHLVLWYLLCLLVGQKLEVSYLSDIFLFNTDKMPIAGALWFLTSLFFVDVLYYLLDRISNIKLKYILIILCFSVGTVVPNYARLPLALDTSLMGIGLFHIGRLYRQYNKKTDFSIVIVIVALIVGSILTYANGYVNVRQGIYSNIYLYLITASLMTWGLYILSKYVSHNKNFIIRELIYIGRNSLVYVCLNQLLLLFFNHSGKIFIHNIFFLFAYKIGVFVITMLVLHIITFFLNRRKLKWIIGK